jgi:hypothetical protein
MMLPLFALAVTACGEDGNGQPAFECTEAHSLCWEISVPQTFTATPVNLYVTGYNSFPPAGMPNAMFNALPAPPIGPGRPLQWKATGIDQFGFTGTKYLAIALLVEGGGAMSPVEGIDWVGTRPEPVEFDGQPKTLPPIELELYDNPATP